jgi:hypothetical protein
LGISQRICQWTGPFSTKANILIFFFYNKKVNINLKNI